jgi:hypothetical protein
MALRNHRLAVQQEALQEQKTELIMSVLISPLMNEVL